MKFLFWNIADKPLSGSVARIADAERADIVILAEAQNQFIGIFRDLNCIGDARFLPVESSNCERIIIFVRFDLSFVSVRYDEPRATIQHYTLPGQNSFLLAAVHIPSKLYTDSQEQQELCEDFAVRIKSVEDEIGHTRTLLVGDLNQNPFEPGIITAKGLHGVMTKDIARRGERRYNRKSYRMFYNPMWGRVGDATPGPPGTFFFNRYRNSELFWHMFDQVLLRPDLMDSFSVASLRILDSDGITSLLNHNGIPSKTFASDHLPLVFELTT